MGYRATWVSSPIGRAWPWAPARPWSWISSWAVWPPAPPGGVTSGSGRTYLQRNDGSHSKKEGYDGESRSKEEGSRQGGQGFEGGRWRGRWRWWGRRREGARRRRV